MGHAPLVDFCNRNELRARTTERSNPAHRTDGRPSAQLFPRVATLGPVESHTLSSVSRWSAASREVTGQGLEATGTYVLDCLGHLPSRSLAAGAWPQPDRLGHLLSQTRSAAGWRILLRQGIVSEPLDEPARRPFAFASTRLSDVARLAADRHPLGPPFTPLREELRNRPHPRCLPSSDGPVRG